MSLEKKNTFLFFDVKVVGFVCQYRKRLPGLQVAEEHGM